MISSNYFSVQTRTFRGIGIDIPTGDSKFQESVIKHPILLYSIVISSLFHFILVTHYAYINITDVLEVTETMPMLCQLLLCLLKVAIFLYKRQEISLLIRKIHEQNFKAKHEELKIVCRENAKDHFLCNSYFRLALVTGTVGVTHPIMYGFYVYFASGEIVLTESNKASYFWDHSYLAGYSLLFALNLFSLYFTCTVSLAFDTLFSWFVSNIVAQFHIICHRYDKLALTYPKIELKNVQQFTKINASIISSVHYHRQTLYLAEKLNQVYGEIIFVKIIIACSEICSLVFRVSYPNDSLVEVAYKTLFLCAVAMQFVLYCWNGQRIKDESMQVSTAIYCAFDWSTLPKSYEKSLLFSMMRSQRCTRVKGVFFEVDLSLYLWIFKTAWSLIAALKTLDENQSKENDKYN